MTRPLPWPEVAPPPPGPTLKAAVKAAGGWFRVLPRFLAAAPWRRGLSLTEYLGYGLHRRPPHEARQHLGAAGAARMAARINHVTNRRGLVGDKMLFDAMLRGSGLAVAPLRAVFGRPAPERTARILDEQGLRRVLSNPAALPLFGRPAVGLRSKDVIAITGFDAESDCALTLDGQQVPVTRILGHLRLNHRGTGFLFQGLIPQHPAVTAAAGPAVATVRVFTLMHRRQCHILGAVWKVPRAGQVADNLWRGNMVAPVDAKTGVAAAAFERPRADAPRHASHPDTGAALEGMELPHWPAVIQQVRRGAGLIQMLPLVGWDIALGPGGPVVVEANTAPAFDLLQLTGGRGLLAGEMGVLLAAARGDARRARLKLWRARRRERRHRVLEWLGLR